MPKPPAEAADAPRPRVALVIGNENYEHAALKLTTAGDDADGMALLLEGNGFEVVHRKDLKSEGMRSAVNEFTDKLKDGGVGLFYYAGHGFQDRQGDNMLAGIDLQPITSEFDLERYSLPLHYVLNAMKAAQNSLNIVILDACRSIPILVLGPAHRGADGLAAVGYVAPVSQSFVAYATKPGYTASDVSPDGHNGLYTSQLLKFLPTPGQPIEFSFKSVREEVLRLSAGKQEPTETTTLTSNFIMAPTDEVLRIRSATLEELAAFGECGWIREYVRRFPGSDTVVALKELMAERCPAGAAPDGTVFLQADSAPPAPPGPPNPAVRPPGPDELTFASARVASGDVWEEPHSLNVLAQRVAAHPARAYKLRVESTAPETDRIAREELFLSELRLYKALREGGLAPAQIQIAPTGPGRAYEDAELSVRVAPQ